MSEGELFPLRILLLQQGGEIPFGSFTALEKLRVPEILTDFRAAR